MTPIISEIQRAACDHFGLSMGEMLSVNRTRKVAGPRQLAVYLAHHMTHRSMCRIGRSFGRDHSTIKHAIERIGAQAHDAGMKRDLWAVRSRAVRLAMRRDTGA